MIAETVSIRRDAVARLAAAFGEALLDFVEDLESARDADAGYVWESADCEEDCYAACQPAMPSDPMTLRQVRLELQLKTAQIVKLRRLWNFPSPVLASDRIVFSRGEVERWARAQPNPEKLAAVLSLRRRR